MISCNSGAPISIVVTTNEKTLHNSDIKLLAKSIKSVHQGVSKLMVKLESPKLMPLERAPLVSNSKLLIADLNCAMGKIDNLRDKLKSSSYNHNESKEQKLESLAAKVADDRSKLEGVAKKEPDNNRVISGFYQAAVHKTQKEEKEQQSRDDYIDKLLAMGENDTNPVGFNEVLPGRSTNEEWRLGGFRSTNLKDWKETK